MTSRPTRLRRQAWLALVAMLALALMPTLSHALAHWRGEVRTEICTVQGMRTVVVDAAGRESEPAGATGPLEHCAYCATTSGGVAPPPAPVALPPPAAAVTRVPPLALQGPRTLHAWLAASPRGPPSFF